jgi:pimeloyl-ACP methyl ester carboxylesterase
MRHPRFGLALIAWLLGATTHTPRATAPGPGAAPLPLAPCHVESLAEEVRCGVAEVVEDRDAGGGRRIPIHVAVLPPLRRAAAPDPLFVLAGGPGQGARSYAGVIARAFKAVRRTRAIVLVDLRGTGDSAPLDCLETRDELAALAQGRDLFLGDGPRCVSELHADPRHYTHRNALADLDEIRARLGYQRINLWGGSWGTRAALIYALGYPAATRRVVLDGAAGWDLAFPRTVAADAQRAFDRVIARCAGEAACAAAFPNAAGALRALLARLDDRAVTVRIAHPRTGAPAGVTLSRDAVAEIVRVALYTTTDAARVLALVHSAAAGNYAPLAAQHVHSASLSSDSMALGATMAILCSEDLPLVAGADFAADARGTFVGSAYADGWAHRCRDWPAGAAPDIDRDARSNAPALILSGLHDPVTPPASGDSMARWFPTHEHVVMPGAAHNTSFTGCTPDVIARFLDGQPTDASCVNDVPLPALVTTLAGGRP